MELTDKELSAIEDDYNIEKLKEGIENHLKNVESRFNDLQRQVNQVESYINLYTAISKIKEYKKSGAL